MLSVASEATLMIAIQHSVRSVSPQRHMIPVSIISDRVAPTSIKHSMPSAITALLCKVARLVVLVIVQRTKSYRRGWQRARRSRNLTTMALPIHAGKLEGAALAALKATLEVGSRNAFAKVPYNTC